MIYIHTTEGSRETHEWKLNKRTEPVVTMRLDRLENMAPSGIVAHITVRERRAMNLTEANDLRLALAQAIGIVAAARQEEESNG